MAPYLLQLLITEVAAHHQAQDLKQLAIGDEPILVDIVHLEGDYCRDAAQEDWRQRIVD